MGALPVILFIFIVWTCTNTLEQTKSYVIKKSAWEEDKIILSENKSACRVIIKFQNPFLIGKVLRKVIITLYATQIKSTDFINSFIKYRNHQENEIIGQLYNHTHLNVYNNNNVTLQNPNYDIDVHVNENSFGLVATFGVNNMNSLNITKHGIYANISAYWIDPVCNFDDGCFLQYGESIHVNDNISDKMCYFCHTLPNNTESLSGKFGHTMKQYHQLTKVWLKTGLVYGSSYGCRLEMSVWQNTRFRIITTITTMFKQIVKVIQHERSERKWKRESVIIGKISEPFLLSIAFESQYLIAVDNIELQNCNKDIELRKCIDPNYRCLSGECIEKTKICDMIYDCFHGDDEAEDTCGSLSIDTTCNFDKSYCGLKQIGKPSVCSWYLANSNSLVLDNILPFDNRNRGMILYLNGRNCTTVQDFELTSPVLTSTFSGKHQEDCKMIFSYILYDTFLQVQLCTDDKTGRDRCKRIWMGWNEYNWTTSTVTIPLKHKSFRIKFVADVDSQNMFEMFAGIDTVSFSEGCIINELTENDKMSIAASIGSLSGGFAFVLTVGIVVAVWKKRQHSNNRIRIKLAINKFTSINSESLRPLTSYAKTSVVSPIYSSTEEICHDTVNDIHCIPRQKITIQRLIGKGAFGEVYCGLLADVAHQHSPLPVAVKTVPEFCSGQAKIEFVMEAVILSKLKHPNIVKFLGVSLENTTVLLVTELLNGGDLKTFLRHQKRKQEAISLKELVDICIDVAKGCMYLEENGFIHRDIAARNCLISESQPKRTVKVADFGMSRIIGSSNYYRKKGITFVPVKWMSPEAFCNGEFSSKTDVWSYGIVLWEVFSLGCVPYPGKTNEEVMQFVQNGGRLSKPDNCPNDMYRLMNECWKLNPQDRPSFCYIGDILLSTNKGKDLCE